MMGRLAYSRVYLAGPISYADDYGHGWREYVSKWLQKRNIVVLNPCDKTKFISNEIDEADDFVKYLQSLKDTGEYDKLGKIVKRIRQIDLRCVDIADWLIVYIDIDVPIMGTAEELFWANRCKKPILVVCKQGINKLNDWLFGCLPIEFFFNSFDEAFGYIKHIDEDVEVDDLGRWVFFDYCNI